MKKVVSFFLVLGICLNLFSVITVFAYEDGDWQFWNIESVEGDLSENWKVKLEEEFRFGNNMEGLYYHHTDGGLTYKLADWFYLCLNYQHIYEKKKTEWKQENIPHINGTIKWK